MKIWNSYIREILEHGRPWYWFQAPQVSGSFDIIRAQSNIQPGDEQSKWGERRDDQDDDDEGDDKSDCSWILHTKPSKIILITVTQVIRHL
jgi:hypothetical protein